MLSRTQRYRNDRPRTGCQQAGHRPKDKAIANIARGFSSLKGRPLPYSWIFGNAASTPEEGDSASHFAPTCVTDARLESQKCPDLRSHLSQKESRAGDRRKPARQKGRGGGVSRPFLRFLSRSGTAEFDDSLPVRHNTSQRTGRSETAGDHVVRRRHTRLRGREVLYVRASVRRPMRKG